GAHRTPALRSRRGSVGVTRRLHGPSGGRGSPAAVRGGSPGRPRRQSDRAQGGARASRRGHAVTTVSDRSTAAPSADMIRSAALLGLVLAFILPDGFAAPPPGTIRPPRNVVLIVADDLGAHDLGCTGSPLPLTPPPARLASA